MRQDSTLVEASCAAGLVEAVDEHTLPEDGGSRAGGGCGRTYLAKWRGSRAGGGCGRWPDSRVAGLVKLRMSKAGKVAVQQDWLRRRTSNADRVERQQGC
eukprot:3506-Chlamydomonas_euryale.AAC.5